MRVKLNILDQVIGSQEFEVEVKNLTGHQLVNAYFKALKETGWVGESAPKVVFFVRDRIDSAVFTFRDTEDDAYFGKPYVTGIARVIGDD